MRVVIALAMLILALGSPSPAQAADQRTLDSDKFGVFPYLSAIRLDKIYAPVTGELSKNLGRKVRFRTSSTFEKFLANIKAEDYDIALIQPFWYPVAVDQHGYLPLLRTEEPFVSLVMVLEDSALRTLDDLRGEVVATPPAFVPVVHMARSALIERGLVPRENVTLRAYKSVDSCFHQVVIGEASACVTPPFAFRSVEKSMGVKFRTLLETPGIPNLALVVHPRVPEQDRDRIKQAILSWSDTESGQALLGNMQTKKFR